MENETRLVKAEEQIVLEIGGRSLRVVGPDRQTLEPVRELFEDHLVSHDAFLAFKVVAPPTPGGLHVLLGADGSVLARSRQSGEVVGSLIAHLRALQAPLPRRGMRFRFHAVVRQKDAVLVEPSLLKAQPVIERRLVTSDCAIVDAFFVDVDLEEMRTLPVELRPHTGPQHAVPRGHCWPSAMYRLTGLIRPTTDTTNTPGPAAIQSEVATRARSGDRYTVLDAAGQLATAVEVWSVDPSRPGSLHRAIDSALSG